MPPDSPEKKVITGSDINEVAAAALAAQDAVEKGRDEQKEAPAEQRGDLADSAAQATVEKPVEKPDEKPDEKKKEELPSNQFSKAYYTLLQSFESDPELKNNSFAKAMLGLLLALSKISGYMDLIPGNFASRLDGDEELKNEKLSEEEINRLKNLKKEDALPEISEENKKQYAEMGNEKSSTQYACQQLLGHAQIDDPALLAARLRHTNANISDQKVPYYREANLSELGTSGMPFGTVLILMTKPIQGEKIFAVATGNPQIPGEFRYMDKTGELKVSSLQELSKKSSALGENATLTMALVPRFNSDPEFFDKHKASVDIRFDDKKMSSLKIQEISNSAVGKIDPLIKFKSTDADVKVGDFVDSAKLASDLAVSAKSEILPALASLLSAKYVDNELLAAVGKLQTALSSILALIEDGKKFAVTASANDKSSKSDKSTKSEPSALGALEETGKITQAALEEIQLKLKELEALKV